MTAPRTWLINLWCAAASCVAAAAMPPTAFADPVSAETTVDQVPPRFHVAESMRPRFAELLERSATFRAQCRRISDAEVRVVFEVGAPWLFDSQIRARSQIIRDETGHVRFVRVQVSREGTLTMVLPHELEHVIEQLEGLDLAAVAHTRNGKVWRVTGHAYETTRAKQVAERVSREYHASRKGGPVATLAER